ncbi:hypothetical protein AB0V79_24970 [Mesorhizobium ciceri]|nr:hypothetical protein [Mesorhizobium ciceri]
MRVRDAIALVFSRFAEIQSIRQVHLSLRSDGIVLRCVSYSREGGRTMV